MCWWSGKGCETVEIEINSVGEWGEGALLFYHPPPWLLRKKENQKPKTTNNNNNNTHLFLHCETNRNTRYNRFWKKRKKPKRSRKKKKEEEESDAHQMQPKQANSVFWQNAIQPLCCCPTAAKVFICSKIIKSILRECTCECVCMCVCMCVGMLVCEINVHKHICVKMRTITMKKNTHTPQSGLIKQTMNENNIEHARLLIQEKQQQQ